MFYFRFFFSVFALAEKTYHWKITWVIQTCRISGTAFLISFVFIHDFFFQLQHWLMKMGSLADKELKFLDVCIGRIFFIIFFTLVSFFQKKSQLFFSNFNFKYRNFETYFVGINWLLFPAKLAPIFSAIFPRFLMVRKNVSQLFDKLNKMLVPNSETRKIIRKSKIGENTKPTVLCRESEITLNDRKYLLPMVTTTIDL